MQFAHIAFAQTREDYWPTWRGPNADGVAPKGDPPVTWSETENIKWKVQLPDSGESTPVIWGNRIFLQTAVPTSEESSAGFSEEHPEKDRHQQSRAAKSTTPWRFGLLCLDRETGKTLWDETAVVKVPHARHHVSSSHSAFSPVTDGERVWASFGSQGLFCFDVEGKQIWQADLPLMEKYSEYGEGASPAIAGDKVIVIQDHMGESAIFAFDKHTGKLAWKQNRGDGQSAWPTPLPIAVDGKIQVVVSGNREMKAYDAATGDVVWTCQVSQTGTVPSPVTGHGNVYYMCGHPGSSVMAIQLGRTGELAGTDAIKWEVTRGAPYVTSPLLYEDRFYFLKKYRGAISSYDAVTGKALFAEEKMDGMGRCYASPVAAAGRIYIADQRGTVTVLKHGDAFEILATNKLDEGFDASPAIVGDELYLRGENHLYCIAEASGSDSK
jgi:outer membrane protein assembly factor BamB